MRVLKRLIFALVITAALLSLSFYVFYMRPRYTVPILMYHSVSSDETSTLNVKPGNFMRQIRFLRAARYNIITLEEFVQGVKDGKSFSHKTVVITFDDGLEDNYINAFPVLVKYKVPATIFLTTDFMEKSGYLKWSEVREMIEKGIEFGAHSKSHSYLPSIKDEALLWKEVAGSKTGIESETGETVGYFCYPFGAFNEATKAAVIKAGYKGACTTNRGPDKFNKDIYELKRVKITNSDMNKPLHFRAKLSGYYNLFRSLKEGGDADFAGEKNLKTPKSQNI